MTDTALHFTMRELQGLFTTPRFWGALAGVSLLLGLVGPFGTYDDLGLPARLAYWAATAAASYSVGSAVVTFLAALFGGQAWSRPVAFAAYGAIAGVPVAVAVWLINAAVYGVGDAISFVPLALYCIAISAIVSPLVEIFTPSQVTAVDSHRVSGASENPPKRPRILDRLPIEQRGQLSHLTMQDHYVEVRTDRGGTLVLMRLADAINETEGVAGLQIHRSHWVATHAVKAAARKDGRLFLELNDGTLLPVSRSFLPAVKAAGFA